MPSPQQPLHTGFGPAATASEVLEGVDLSGRIAVVTGGYSGLGLETARALAAAGAEVIVPARDLAKADAALRGTERVTVAPLDLLSPASIEGFACTVLDRHPAVHMLVDSAGIMANPLTRDARGYESQFATNHLGHYHLAARLWPALVLEGARVVSVSSRGHQRADVDLDDPQFELTPYDPWVAYGRSKTANALFAVALDRRGEAHGVRAFSLHPGGILTDLARHMSAEELRRRDVMDADGRPVIDPNRDKKTPAQGAATSVWCAAHPQLDGLGGVYCLNCDVAEVLAPGAASTRGVMPYAIDPDRAERLMQLSERLTGAAFPPV